MNSMEIFNSVVETLSIQRRDNFRTSVAGSLLSQPCQVFQFLWYEGTIVPHV